MRKGNLLLENLIVLSIIILFLFGCTDKSHKYTRGIGIYPGDPKQDFSPEFRIDNETYRNLAKNRLAFNSSSYDYNLTAQLVTDGIITEGSPAWVSVSTNEGLLPKNEREWVLDHNSFTSLTLNGNEVWIQVENGVKSQVSGVTKVSISGDVSYRKNIAGPWSLVLMVSDDGNSWEVLQEKKGYGLPGTEKPDLFEQYLARFKPAERDSILKIWGANRGEGQPQRDIEVSFELEKPVNFQYYRIDMKASPATKWTVGDVRFFNGNKELEMTPSHSFKSAWMSAGSEKEWVYVDLGADCVFDSIALHWIHRAFSGKVKVSSDLKNWKTIANLAGNGNLVDKISLATAERGRYVKVTANTSIQGERVVLGELEVYGTGGPVPVPKNGPVAGNSRMDLAGGSWKIQRASLVDESGQKLSTKSFDDSDWLIATVPATVLSSYRNAGALPDPNYGDNQLMISESFFNSDFWYRNVFKIPKGFDTGRIFLNFDGINWKAQVYLNGKELGHIEGAFKRGKFDVSELVKIGEENTLAVRIIKNDHIGVVKEQTATSPDKNGGILGADNPTFHASIGWDWIPTIRGRNIGIWNDVYITKTGEVTIENPLVRTDLPLPDTLRTEIILDVTLNNHSKDPVRGYLKGTYGEISFKEEITLSPNESKKVHLDGMSHPELFFENPRLWWPNGYGKPYLYDVSLSFVTDNGISDQKTFKSGVREMAFNDDDGVLKIYINGRRFIGRGGNWGFPESNLNYRGREYDVAVRYHADMNFTMIRNWVGQTGDDEFYEACDKYGIMVWQDFWLANPADGPNPYNPDLFLDNAEDMVLRIRNHPSIALYCGRNEGNPPRVLDTALNKMIKKIHPGIHYISNSSLGVVSGGGPYRALPVRDYYTLYGADKFHSERGMPNVMTWESLKKTIPESEIWPQNNLWGLHDYCLEGAQGAASFNELIEKAFGSINSAKQFSSLAQRINYDGYRGMFEGRSPLRKGLLLWMSHPAWPSMVWQTYDYYFEPTAAYFGCKKASEPIHIQWNPTDNSVEVVNYSAGPQEHVLAKAQILNSDGTIQWQKEHQLNSGEDSTEKCFNLQFDGNLSPVHFIKLTLIKDERHLSENIYWRGVEEGNYQSLNDLPVIELIPEVKVSKYQGKWLYTVKLRNNSDFPGLMAKIKIIGADKGQRILPVLYSDNYIDFMPGDEKVVTIVVDRKDTYGEKPVVELSGFNIKTKHLK